MSWTPAVKKPYITHIEWFTDNDRFVTYPFQILLSDPNRACNFLFFCVTLVVFLQSSSLSQIFVSQIIVVPHMPYQCDLHMIGGFLDFNWLIILFFSSMVMISFLDTPSRLFDLPTTCSVFFSPTYPRLVFTLTVDQFATSHQASPRLCLFLWY